MINKLVLRNLIGKRRNDLLNQKRQLYIQELSSDEIISFQIQKFNDVWSSAVNNFNFYKSLKEEYSIPQIINSPEDLRKFPILNKEMIKNSEESIAKDLTKFGKFNYIRTGGTSGSTTRFPSNSRQRDVEYANTYLGKSWHQIKPLDKIIHIWGHSHLFGSGVQGKINEIKRFAINTLINTRRLNAYQLDISSVETYIKKIFQYKPKAIIGYTSSLFIISKFIIDNEIDIRLPNLKGIILTTESASNEDVDVIQKAFNANVILEYGMAETGVIAYSDQSTFQCKVLWDSFICIENSEELILSTIYKRWFPLINYGTGDKLVKGEEINGSVFKFQNIEGRQQDIFKIFSKDCSKEIPISAVMIVHMLKEWPGVLSIASKQLAKGKIEIHLYGENIDFDKVKVFLLKKITQEIGNISPDSIVLIKALAINRSLAGKHISIIK